MKTHGALFDRIADRENLRLAYARAVRGKRDRPDARAFAAHLEDHLGQLAADLRAGSVRVGECRQFTIHDPKERLITAPCFRERVLHHAILNVCEPVFERLLISDTYACRKGLGRFAAIDRAVTFAGRRPFYLKMDIRKYFDSIPHAGLLARLARHFRERPLLDLFAAILAAHEASPGRGLPIGSLTSQHWANFYLGAIDRLIKETWRAPGYVRYMDDFVCWADDRATLREWRDRIGVRLSGEMGLEFKAAPILQRTALGMDFLGSRVFPHRANLSKCTRRRIRRELAALEGLHDGCEIGEAALQTRATALFAQARAHPIRSWRFRTRLLLSLSEGKGHRARTA